LRISASKASRQCSGVLSASSLNITNHCMAGATAGGSGSGSGSQALTGSTAAHAVKADASTCTG
jgi:hypothetical protein